MPHRSAFCDATSRLSTSKIPHTSRTVLCSDGGHGNCSGLHCRMHQSGSKGRHHDHAHGIRLIELSFLSAVKRSQTDR